MLYSSICMSKKFRHLGRTGLDVADRDEREGQRQRRPATGDDQLRVANTSLGANKYARQGQLLSAEHCLNQGES